MLDLIVGTSNTGYGSGSMPYPDGELILFLNTGTKEQYRFHREKTVTTVNGATISGPSYTMFATGDLDRDGLFDIVTRSYDSGLASSVFSVYRNSGAQGDPQFDNPVLLCDSAGRPVLPCSIMSRFSLADWNGDGWDDLITEAGANSQTKVWVYLARPTGTPILQGPAPIHSGANSVAVRTIGGRTIALTFEHSGAYTVEAINAQGRSAWSHTQTFTCGSAVLEMPITSAGWYAIRVRQNGSVVTQVPLALTP